MKIVLRRKCGGFSRVELALVITLIIAMGTFLYLAVLIGKERSRRNQCRENLRTIHKALSVYANDNKGLLPDCTRDNPKFFGAVWPWDVNSNVISELQSRGAQRNVFYCPSNPDMNNDQHWDFPKYSGAPCRVVGYVFLLNGCIQIPTDLWRKDLKGLGGRPPDQVELVLDATVNQGGNYAKVGGLNVDRSNHMVSGKPSGGNIVFEDGHTTWRPFKEMRHQIYGQAVWDF